jgi:hypothetical protein
MSAIVIFGIQLISRMLCEADRRMTCEQLKAHPVRPFTLRLIGADGSSSTGSIGLQSEISTLHSFHTLNQLPILRTSQLMRLIRRMIYLLVRRMGMMRRRIWLSWVIRMSLSCSPSSSCLPRPSIFPSPLVLPR